LRGLGYNTKRIHSINIRGKYLRKTLLKTFSDLSRPFGIAVVSIALLVIFLPNDITQNPPGSGESRQI
jgi:hypothetical protein